MDFRKGIDGLVQVCRQRLRAEPICGAFIFANRRRQALKILCYDGQGYGLCQSRLVGIARAVWLVAPCELGGDLGPGRASSAIAVVERSGLSALLCQAWNWVQPNGQLRDMVARSLMLEWHRAGHIELPAKRVSPPNNAARHSRPVSGPLELPLAPRALEFSLAQLGALDGHAVYLLETFIDPERFRGTCYRAANWIYLGLSAGLGKDARSHVPNRSLKELWVYPLRPDFRRHLCGGGHG